MRKPKNITRHLFGLVLALVGLTLPASAQNTPLGINRWSSNGPGGGIVSLAIAPSNPNIIYAATGGGVFKSTNAGASWYQTGGAFYIVTPQGLVLDPANSNIVYAGAYDGVGVYKSVDGGVTWSAGTGPAGAHYVVALVIDPLNTNILYVAVVPDDDCYISPCYPGGVFKSTDGGVTWSSTTLIGRYVSVLAIDPVNSAVIYAATYANGVYKTINAGASWSALSIPSHFYQVLAIDPVNTNTIYAASACCGVFKSTNGGATWSATGLTLHTNALALDPRSSATLYAGTQDQGVLKSTDGGTSWNAFNDGLTNLQIDVMAIDRSGTFLHVGTSTGVFDYQLDATNPIDDAQTFVRQHYRDFLNREPDAAGLAFWTSEINLCGSDPGCIQAKRVNVSAAYFLSIEFQQTGYLVERIYKASYGDANGTSTFNGSHQLPVPGVRLNEFLPDTQEIGRGVVVGVGNWQQQLETNKQAFTTEFVQRSRFTTAFGTSMTPTQFVDTLFANAGVTPLANDRANAINDFGSATTASDVAARSRALRDVAENPTLNQQEFNRAFVLMQFLGYLRRNPNDAPDADYTGYDFWLTKLNQFNGNFVNAEMVKAFIVSGEYRNRFGP